VCHNNLRAAADIVSQYDGSDHEQP
jgi:hypothetical protein